MTWIPQRTEKEKQIAHKTLNEFWNAKGSGQLQSVRNGGPCEWCDRFQPLKFRVCMNCGAVLNE